MNNILPLLTFVAILAISFLWTNPVFGALGVTVLVNPAPDATDVPFTVVPDSGNFDWEDVTGAETYEIRYVKTTDICSAIADALWTHLVTHPIKSKINGLASLVPGKRYCWAVRAEASPAVSSWSESRAFTTKQVAAQCSDGIDNDGDGLVDYSDDPGCENKNDNNESEGGGNYDGDNGNDGDGGSPSTLKNPISAQNITELFSKIFSFLFGLAIFIVPVIVIYAAFLMLMGGGDPVKLAKGRMILLWTAVAFIIILLAKGLPVVFKNLL